MYNILTVFFLWTQLNESNITIQSIKMYHVRTETLHSLSATGLAVPYAKES